MPELPEVETIRRGLTKELIGQKIASVDVRHAKSLLGDVRQLIGQKITEVNRRAKLLIIRLEDSFLIIHLKMTGQLIYVPKNNSYQVVGGHPDKLYSSDLPHKYTHVIFELEKGKLYFNDLRKFGWLKIGDEASLKAETSRYGPEYTWPAFTAEYLGKKLAKKNITIKQALLDQELLAGLGNIYADETLFSARINPRQKANSLSVAQVKKIFKSIPQVLDLALSHGGTSSRDYRRTDGSMGTYLAVAKVYKRAGQPCTVCGLPIERIKIAGRSSHFCPSCQKLNRKLKEFQKKLE